MGGFLPSDAKTGGKVLRPYYTKSLNRRFFATFLILIKVDELVQNVSDDITYLLVSKYLGLVTIC